MAKKSRFPFCVMFTFFADKFLLFETFLFFFFNRDTLIFNHKVYFLLFKRTNLFLINRTNPFFFYLGVSAVCMCVGVYASLFVLMFECVRLTIICLLLISFLLNIVRSRDGSDKHTFELVSSQKHATCKTSKTKRSSLLSTPNRSVHMFL